MDTLQQPHQESNPQQHSPLPPDLSTTGFSHTQRRLTPSIEFEVVSMRDTIDAMPTTDREKLEALVSESDPSLEHARSRVLSQHPDLKDISVELAAAVTEELAQGLSAAAAPALATIVDFYFGYLRPFPDVTETEPLASLLGYLRDNPEWDVLMAKSTSGQIIGACSGQIVNVPCASGDFKIAWNEHTWVDRDYRRNKVGETLASLFSDRARSEGAAGVVIETDNPFLISDDPRAFTHADTEARSHFWTSQEEGLGQAMDPFNRFKFWGGQGFGVICAGDPAAPIPYSQISLDLGTIGSCETINLAMQPTSPEFATGMSKEQYKAALLALQQTIDEHAGYYPELARTLRQIDETPGEMLRYVRLTDESINQVLESARESKTGAAAKDLAYCELRLTETSISAEEREILEKSKSYLLAAADN